MKLDSLPQRIFLTGATGVLGGRILQELLQATSCRICCLARGNAAGHSRERVRSILRVYDTAGVLEPQFHSRVTVIEGDVTQERFGLSASRYSELQAETDITIHAAANTSLLAKYKHLEPVNVRGTARVIEFSLGTDSKNLAFVSTTTVMGDKTFDDRVRFRESDYDLGQGFDHLNYQRSKFLAEALVREARERGLRWRIFRPGQIYGDSITGAYPHSATEVTGLFYDLFRTAMETRVMPEAYLHYDVVPVDYVSRGLLALCAEVDNFFEVYHLANPDAKSFVQVMGLLRSAGYPIDLLPEPKYKHKLRHREITRDGTPYTSIILQAFTSWYFIARISFYSSAITDCEYTRSRLEALGVSCAPLNQRLIETYVRAGVRAGYFPSPSLAQRSLPADTVAPGDLLGAEGSAS